MRPGEFGDTIADLESKLQDLDVQQAALEARRAGIESALQAIRALDAGPVGATEAKTSKRRAPKGAAAGKAVGCPTCKGSAKARPCHTCGVHRCAKCGMKPYARHCTGCAKKAPAAVNGASPKAAVKAGRPRASVVAPAAAAATVKKKCEGCGQGATKFGPCERCGADYCKERCLMNSKDCPACQRLLREV